jgi:hypothetical protein
MEVVITAGLDATLCISCSAKHSVVFANRKAFRDLTTGGLIALVGCPAVP